MYIFKFFADVNKGREAAENAKHSGTFIAEYTGSSIGQQSPPSHPVCELEGNYVLVVEG
jgi:hypothetical protein